jgi:NAD+ kinase
MPSKLNKVNKISFYSRENNADVKGWKTKIESWLEDNQAQVEIVEKSPDAVIVLGGDGTIMEASRKYANEDVVIFGINLGQLGFLSTVNNPEDFPSMLKRFFNGEYTISPGMIVRARVIRDKKEVYVTDAFNEVVVQNPLGIVEINVVVRDEVVESIQGSGILVATPLGSTAYNLSAHGPVVAPGIDCLVVTELFDHDIPTPSLVLSSGETIKLIIEKFREHKLLKIGTTGEPLDVLLIADGRAPFVLKQKDEIQISRANSQFKLASFEPNQFFKNFRSKFDFK